MPSLLQSQLSDLLASGFGAVDLLDTLLQSQPSLVSVVDEQGQVLLFSPNHRMLSGVSEEPEPIQHIDALFPPFIRQRFSAPLHELVLQEDLTRWEMSVQHRDGQVHLYDVQHWVFEGEGQRWVLTAASDVSGQRRAQNETQLEQKSQLNYLSFHDPLTGLANRSLFYDRAHKSLSRSKRHQSSIALLLIDLDRFKNINDSLGHDAGDYFLKQIAQRLGDALRDTDTVARLGGDEFVVILENIAQAEDIVSITEKLLSNLSKPIDVSGHEVACTASIGVALYPKDGDSIDQLLKHADLAMYKAKAQGKNRTQFYVQAMTDTAVNYLLLENDLRKAIDNGDLCLHFQPQVDLQSRLIAGVEALVRWEHPERGMISPGEFIPLAEETGLIEPLGDWVLLEACQRFQAWMSQGIHLGKVAVNLSSRQFRQEHFEQTIVKTLLQSRLSPEYLELELTESTAMENAAETIELLNAFANMGVSLAIDDFGTGYSSLAYLKRFPINKLKIDRSFIHDIDTNEADAAIAKSIIDLAHNMTLQVIAEGVERMNQAQWLMDHHCDQVQGFYYSRPLTEAALLELVRNPQRMVVSSSGVRLLV